VGTAHPTRGLVGSQGEMKINRLFIKGIKAELVRWFSQPLLLFCLAFALWLAGYVIRINRDINFVLYFALIAFVFSWIVWRLLRIEFSFLFSKYWIY
jgi:hypothetical protein